MKTRLLFSSLAATALAFSGCDKILKPKVDERAPANESASAEPGTVAATPEAAAETATAAPASAPAAETPAAAAPAAPTEPAAPAVVVNKDASVMVLCYHRFEPNPKDDLAISPEEFERQLQALKDNGFTVIGMQDFLAWRKEEKSIPAKSVLITIDDGYNSCYDTAWPILKKFDYPFTMFVYMNYISAGGKSITWDQLGEMRDAGVDIQSHTYSHQSLKGKGVNKAAAAEIKSIGYHEWLKKEIAGSKEALETRLGIRVNALAYPYGVYSDEARALIEASGYEAAFTVYGQRVGFDSPHDLIGRYAIGSKNPQIFQAAIKMIGGGGGDSAPVSRVSQIAAASMATQPMEGETISDPRPIIRANLASMGKIDAGSVEMRISGLGLVPSVYDDASKLVSFQPTDTPLTGTHYTVIITAKIGGKRAETRWAFKFDPAAPAAAAHDDAVLPEGAPAR